MDKSATWAPKPSGVQSLIPEIESRYVTYGESHQADYRADRIELAGHAVRFDAWHGEQAWPE